MLTLQVRHKSSQYLLRLACIRPLFTAYLDLQEIPQPLHMIDAQLYLSICIDLAPVLDLYQLYQTILLPRLCETGPIPPLWQKISEQLVHLFDHLSLRLQGEGTFGTLTMFLVDLLIKLKF